MLAGQSGEGVIVIATNQRAARVAEECKRYGIEIARDYTAILDCMGEEDPTVPARVMTVSGPRDLTGIGMRFSDVFREFHRSGIEQVRTGLFSVSTLLSFGDLRTVSRFVHTVVGRIDTVDGLGVFLIDPANHDDRTVSTIGQFCTGRIDIRETEGDPELRTQGIPGQSRDWTSFSPHPTN
jgi:hypothetical protein